MWVQVSVQSHRTGVKLLLTSQGPRSLENMDTLLTYHAIYQAGFFFQIVLEPSQEQDNDRTLWKLMTETEY